MFFQLKYGHAMLSAVGRADWSRASAPAQMTAWRGRTVVLTTRLCAMVSRGCWRVGLGDFTGTQFLTERETEREYLAITPYRRKDRIYLIDGIKEPGVLSSWRQQGVYSPVTIPHMV